MVLITEGFYAIYAPIISLYYTYIIQYIRIRNQIQGFKLKKVFQLTSPPEDRSVAQERLKNHTNGDLKPSNGHKLALIPSVLSFKTSFGKHFSRRNFLKRLEPPKT